MRQSFRSRLAAIGVVAALCACGQPTAEPASGDLKPQTAVSDSQVPSDPVTAAPAPTQTNQVAECSGELELGCSGGDVAELQRLLSGSGVADLTVDGDFGPATLEALQAFEASCGSCEADGRITVDGAEWVRLQDTQVDEGSGQQTAFPTAFGAWVGGGDIGNDCGDVMDRGGAEPVSSPHIAFGWDVGETGAASLQAGYQAEMCIIGFAVDEPVGLEVRGPTGEQRAQVRSGPQANASLTDVLTGRSPSPTVFEVDDSWGHLFSAYEPVLLPVGTYELTATQGDLVATRVLEVVGGDLGDPGLRIIRNANLETVTYRPGDAFPVILVGFAPGSEVPLALYVNDSRVETDQMAGFSLVKELSPATMNEHGYALHEVIVPDIGRPEHMGPAGPQYCVATIPSLREMYCQPWVDATFDVAGS